MALIVLVLFVIVLTVTTLPGVFIIDETHYSVSVSSLRDGRLTLPGISGLPPSREWLYFLPSAPGLKDPDPPMASDAPPLYAFLAFPFSFAGWRGLVFLNTLAVAACGWMVFVHTRRFAPDPRTAWLALLTFLFGSYVIEYAQGVWPHGLSAALCTAGFLLASAGRNVPDTGAHRPADRRFACAGLALGVATGVRYPNIAYAGAVAAGILLLGPRRLRSVIVLLAGMIPPLLLSSFLNQARSGSWNPISKSGAYLRLEVVEGVREGLGHGLAMGFRALASRLVDFSLHHPLPVGFTPSPESDIGAILCMGVLKKAWLQSVPWVLVVLTGLAIAVFPPRNWRRDHPREREGIAAALVIGAMLAVFTLAGPGRIDGLCFNARYFFDLLPLCAVVFAGLIAEPVFSRRGWFFGGIALGAAIVLAILRLPPEAMLRQLALLKIPVVLAVGAALAWLAARRGQSRLLAALLAGVCLGWACATHIAEDLRGSRLLRRVQARRLHEAKAALPCEPAAVFAYWGYSVALGPLQLSRDLLIADPWIDGGETAPAILDGLLAQGRRVFIVVNDFDRAVYDRLVHGRRLRWLHTGELGILEVLPNRLVEP